MTGLALVECWESNAARVFVEVLTRALPLWLLLRNAAILGPLQLPQTLMGPLGIVLALTTAPSGHWGLRCQTQGAMLQGIPSAAFEGLLLALLIRQSLFVVEALAESIESQLQLVADPKRPTPGGALSTLCLALFAVAFWRDPVLTLDAAETLPLRTLVFATLDTLTHALNHALRAVVSAALVFLCGELFSALCQRVLPNVISWQFSLPLRFGIGLFLFKALVLTDPVLGGTR